MKLGTTYTSDSKTVLYNYKGIIDQDILKSVVSFHENVLNEYNSTHSYKRKVITSIIEALQNISRYGLKNEDGKPSGEFVSYLFEKKLTFECTNWVTIEQVDEIKKKLDDLNACPIDELKSRYVQKLNDDWFNPQTGAKLGLIYLFINSDKNINYHFLLNDENSYLFNLKVCINPSQTENEQN